MLKRIRYEIGLEPKKEYHSQNGTFHYYNNTINSEATAMNNWLTRFILKNFPLITKKINIYGEIGNNRFIKRSSDGIKIFHSGENLDKKGSNTHYKYGDYCLKYVDLALGFNNDIENSKYLRFPLWIMYLFAPEDDKDKIDEKVKAINALQFNKTKSCALIARHDKDGTRGMIYNKLKNIIDIECAGKWNNNTNDMWDLYNNDKIEYLKQFKFNICPENANTRWYVTEKLFEAFVAGCIPIYYGSDNDPEPGIVNKDAVIFWDKDGDNSKQISFIQQLLSDEQSYNEFINQPKLLPYTTEYVFDRYVHLLIKLNLLLN